jgi:cytochrome c553
VNRQSKSIPVWLFGILATVLLFACAPQPQQGGTAWGGGAFDSNGERIYFTATNENGTNITYTGGPSSGMMMGGGYLTCASCHGPDGRGGVHTMMGMQTMNAPDIGGAAYNLETFRLAVVKGQHPDGTSLSANMPRWNVSDEDLADLAEYLKTRP